MITLTGARKRADEFAAAVDAPADAPATTPARPDLAELVGVVTTLRTHAATDVTPRPDFSVALRERLMTEAEASWTYDPQAARLTLPSRPTTRRERRLTVAATALVLAGGTAGMAAAAQQALQGEALYPIKRGIEDVRTDLTGDSAAKGRTLLDQASSRLTEARTLVEEPGTDPVVGSTIETFSTQARSGSDLLIDSYAQTGDERSVGDVRAFTEDGLTQLESLSALVPAELQPTLRDAVLTLEEIEMRAAEACPTCGADDALTSASSSFKPTQDAARALERLQGESLSNDHPLISDEMVPDAPAARERQGGTDAGSSGGQGDNTGGAADDVTGGDLGNDLTDRVVDGLSGVEATNRDVTENLDRTLRGTEDAVKKGTDAVRDAVRKQTDKAQDTVDKTLEDATDSLPGPGLP